ncbi:primosomal protein N' [Acidobacteria bacterium AH-259-D05]|nr:primosomal protein N' [Acidobacteria bacterium AH-259-D05]
MAGKRKNSGTFVDVAVPLPLFQTFVYSVPDSISSELYPGSRVFVPFGTRQLIAMAVRVHQESRPGEVKTIGEILDREPLLPPLLLELGLWMASYYLAPPGETLKVMLPPGLLARKSVLGKGHSSRKFWPEKRQLAVVSSTSGDVKLTERQQEVFRHLAQSTLPVLVQPLLRHMNCSRSVLKSLASKGLIQMESVEAYRSPWSHWESSMEVKKHPLTPDQQRIFGKIKKHLAAGKFHSMLIHGVTGSGKTEVYLNAIADALARGRSALVLVPEIGLTPQILRYFRAWFGQEVAILHSALSEGERFDQWRRIRRGQARVVVGTRSAVFAPLRDLGIIIVDEEHDGSYKQEDLPRYNARDVARKRGQLEKALVILGSATPQLETFYHSVHRGEPEYETLSSRILERPLPTIHVVDMREEFQKHGQAVVISEPLRKSIAARLDRREQVLILLNRRGYASAILCRSCGNTETCESCSISLTYHRHSNRLVCHYCGYVRPVPTQCRACGKEYIYFLGHGTEKVQQILAGLFPEAVIDRLDRDTVQRKGSFQRILGTFASGQTDVLIGTQMIAKGHDFPRVTLVGVLTAEQALRMADFRAAERTFQLLTQVAGRAGRGEHPGEVVIQTYYPNHYSLKYARSQDYRLFFEEEIRFRRNFQYPPFTALANLMLQGEPPHKIRRQAEQVTDLLLQYRTRLSSGRRMRVLGPAQAPLEKLKGQYRFQILIKATSRKELHHVLESAMDELQQKKAILKKPSIDVDPLNLL